jgi:hypothetical protein
MQIPEQLRSRLVTLLWVGIVAVLTFCGQSLSSWLAPSLAKALPDIPSGVWLSLVLSLLVFSGILAWLVFHLNGRLKQSEKKAEEGLVFIAETGIFHDPATGLYYCPKCIKGGTRSPMQTTNPRSYCKCNACETVVTGPEHKHIYLA